MTTATMTDSTARLGDGAALLDRFREDGYVLLRGVVAADVVDAVRQDLLAAIAGCGWLKAGTDPSEAQPGELIRREGDAGWWEGYAAIQGMQGFHAMAHRPELVAAVRALVGDDILVHPRKIARVTYPGSAFPTPPHQDFPLIQGTPDTCTLWMPFGDCTTDMGALRILQGSHRQGLRRAVARSGVGGIGVEVDADDPGFVTTEYQPGDVVIFHSYTVHYAPPNESGRLRLSADYRYQSVSDPVLDMSLNPHGHPVCPGWEELTAGWSSRAAVDHPRGLTITHLADPMGDLGNPPSRLLAEAAARGAV